MNFKEVVARIMEINRSATQVFLEGFEIKQLQEYLDRLLSFYGKDATAKQVFKALEVSI